MTTGAWTRTIAIVIAAYASTAGAAIYKCTEAGGQVLYSDVPCKGGSVVDVRPGDADPAAIARLERDRAEFDRNMVARRAADDAAALQRAALDARLREAEAAQRVAEETASAAVPYYSPLFVVPHVKRHSHPHKVRPAPKRNVPASPVPLHRVPGNRVDW
jgi:hypothetical protein